MYKTDKSVVLSDIYLCCQDNLTVVTSILNVIVLFN